MRTELIDVMQDQVRTIYRALTGNNIPEIESSAPRPDAPLAEITRRFVELETVTRTDPFLSELVPPFSFTPPLDAFYSGDHVVVELAIPGVDRSDLNVEIVDGTVVISGVRRVHADFNGASFSHAEIPRGPFYRAFHVPLPVRPEPDVTLERGLLRIQLKRSSEPQREEAEHRNTQGH